MKRVLVVLRTPVELTKVKEVAASSSTNTPALAGNTQQQELLPKIAELDPAGNPMFEPEEWVKPEHPVEIIAWKPWLTHAAGSVDAVSSKAILRTAICELDGNYRLNLETLPVAIVRRGKDVWCKTTRDIDTGTFIVPL